MRNMISACVLAAAAAPLLAQTTGRTMQLLAPVVLGQTATFGMTYPGTAAGSPYAFLWCMPPFAGTQTLTVPGFTVQGLLRVLPASSVASYTGVLGGSGSVAHSLVVPSHPSFLGVAWDLQSVDLSLSASLVSLADNDLSLVVSGSPPATMNMVPIAPGAFLMGSQVTPLDVQPYFNQAVSQPVHAVTISRAFWMGKYEVTQAQYQAVMSANPSRFQGPAYPNAGNRPVERVTWFEAVAYCTAITAQEEAAGRLPSGYVYRLPTEAEWEYCSRAGTTSEFSYGSSLVCGQDNFNFSYHSGVNCGIGQTQIVGSFAPNPWGLHDMHGNVWEWCLDGWDGSANYPAASVSDPYEPASANGDRVIRGGSWFNNSFYGRSAYRFQYSPSITFGGIGFRIVLGPVVP
ncbi:MAG: formylglycine-generating enzyme family protein [Planctomycetes bacterium]|nr:formylglycine-generating enzyme family protein [Planctomycetota bacterium]